MATIQSISGTDSMPSGFAVRAEPVREVHVEEQSRAREKGNPPAEEHKGGSVDTYA